ncbi:protein cortex-like [Anopheles maculipalpis]|uniref:protein cortex-like n=1 Tax=Anopheles maculipalpis TaxID=1496333 RepID=UPI0021592663|nr:protein cortex-like [Anopheles maculipalpis]
MCAFFDWHPWREDEIVIADSEPIMIALYHVPSRQVVSYYRRQDSDCIVTTLSFNKISGELVVCYSFTDANKPPEILVLASMDRVVDVMHNHDDVIVHLLWSPDGKQLASVGYDETLTIWNFFGISPTNKCERKKLQRESSASSSRPRDGESVVGGLLGGRDASRIQCNRNKEATYRDLASSFLQGNALRRPASAIRWARIVSLMKDQQQVQHRAHHKTTDIQAALGGVQHT